MSVDIREVSICSADAQKMIALLDRELSGAYAPEHRHPVDFGPFHQEGGIFVVAYDAGTSIACGALRPLNAEEVELKRMFVLDAYRGRGVSRKILAYLEERARQLGFGQLLLETGDEQHAAIGLYDSSGFLRIEPFGEYALSPRSVCFAKDLS